MQERAQQSCHATRSCWFFFSPKATAVVDVVVKRIPKLVVVAAVGEQQQQYVVGCGRHRRVHVHDAEEESHQGANQRGCYRIERKSRAAACERS